MSDIDGLLEELTGPGRPSPDPRRPVDRVLQRWGRLIIVLAAIGALALLALAGFVG